MHIYVYAMAYYSPRKRYGIFPFAATWKDLEGIMLRNRSHRKMSIIGSLLHVESKKANNQMKNKLRESIEAESREDKWVNCFDFVF